LSLWKLFEVHRFTLSSPHCILMAATSGACIFFIKCWFSIKICCVLLTLKSSYCGKNFMSIHTVLNVCEQFEVQNSHIFALQWTLVAYNFFIHGLFLVFFIGKVVHTSLVFFGKISYQSKRLWVNENHFSRGRFSHRCDFLVIFSLFFDISIFFCWNNESIEWYFFPSMCLDVGFESLCSLHFFHLSKFRNRPNVFRKISTSFFNSKTL